MTATDDNNTPPKVGEAQRDLADANTRDERMPSQVETTRKKHGKASVGALAVGTGLTLLVGVPGGCTVGAVAGSQVDRGVTGAVAGTGAALVAGGLLTRKMSNALKREVRVDENGQDVPETPLEQLGARIKAEGGVLPTLARDAGEATAKAGEGFQKLAEKFRQGQGKGPGA